MKPGAVQTFLRALYRESRGRGALGKTLRQGVRIGLQEGNAAELATFVGVVDAGDLTLTAKKIRDGEDLGNELRSVLGRFELAVDARIDAALALAESAYVGGVRVLASVVALLLALGSAVAMEGGLGDYWRHAAIVGIAAVPLAPIAKDVAAGIGAARTAFLGRKRAL